MVTIASMASVASLIGDPARANMLFALKDDGTISAGDLSAIAGVAASTASEHLGKLIEAGLVTVTARGRRRYYSLAVPDVADILEGLESVATTLSHDGRNPSPDDRAMLHARCCYDHLAGRVGVRLAVALMAKGFISHGPTGPDLTGDGEAWLGSLKVDVGALRADPRRFMRLCPDWSEKSIHIGGAVGAAMLRGMVGLDWLRRERGSRSVIVTHKGAAELRARLDLDIGAP